MKKQKLDNEQELVEKINEAEYKKSLKGEPQEEQSNRGAVTEEGWTNQKGAFVASQGGNLTPDQSAQIDATWVKYQKFADGSYEFEKSN